MVIAPLNLFLLAEAYIFCEDLVVFEALVHDHFDAEVLNEEARNRKGESTLSSSCKAE